MIEIRFDLPFEEQLAFFRQKGYALSPDSWRDVWQKAHARAFTVARVSAMDVLMDIRKALDEAMEKGLSLKSFQSELPEILERKGWFAPKGEPAVAVQPDGTVRKRLTGWRLENIYRTNLQAAYQVGRYEQAQEVKSTRPYWQYKAVMDASTRPEHAAMHNKVWHAEHPVWNQWYPPNGFGCRCYVKTLSERQLRARGLTEEKRGVNVKPDEGFRYNPGEAGLDAWKPDLNKYPIGLSDQFMAEVPPDNSGSGA